MKRNLATIAGGALLVGFAALVSAPAAEAGLITVINPSFEILPAGGLPFPCAGAGCGYSVNDPIPGWSSVGSFGQFQPVPAANGGLYFNSVPDGDTVAYSNGGTISQVLTAIAQAGVTYTLQVDMGFRHDVANPGTVALNINGNIVFATGAAPQGSGDWVTYTAIYTATAADAGAPISIILDAPGAQGDWDNVRLDVPEPSAIALIAAALLSLAGLGRLRRRVKT